MRNNEVFDGIVDCVLHNYIGIHKKPYTSNQSLHGVHVEVMELIVLPKRRCIIDSQDENTELRPGSIITLYKNGIGSSSHISLTISPYGIDKCMPGYRRNLSFSRIKQLKPCYL